MAEEIFKDSHLPQHTVNLAVAGVTEVDLKVTEGYLQHPIIHNSLLI